MSFFSGNRLLIAVLVVGLTTACCSSIPALLRQVKDAARAPPPEPAAPARSKRLQKDSENSLRVETLRTLADGYSHELRTSALKIVAGRTVRSRARGLLLRDLAGRDDRRRDNAINALWMVFYHPALSDTDVGAEFYDPKGVTAVVQALINVLPLHDTDNKSGLLPPSPIRPTSRPAHEVSLLNILNNILQEECRRSNHHVRSSPAYVPPIQSALKAGLVTVWLANYPFPCALSDSYNYKKCDVARLFDRMSWKSDDPLMADIIFQVIHDRQGHRQMRDVGLQGAPGPGGRGTTDDGRWHDGRWHSGWPDDEEDDDSDDDDDDYTDRDWMLPNRNVARSAERSLEEEHLRRRHREAVVVAERGAPLGRENILQRDDTQRLLQPMDGVSEVEGVLNGLLGLSTDESRQGEDSIPESPASP
jgi:hypothetical protein